MLSVNDTGLTRRWVDGRVARAGSVSLKSCQSREAGLYCGLAALRRAERADRDEPVAARLTVDCRHSG